MDGMSVHRPQVAFLDHVFGVIDSETADAIADSDFLRGFGRFSVTVTVASTGTWTGRYLFGRGPRRAVRPRRSCIDNIDFVQIAAPADEIVAATPMLGAAGFEVVSRGDVVRAHDPDTTIELLPTSGYSGLRRVEFTLAAAALDRHVETLGRSGSRSVPVAGPSGSSSNPGTRRRLRRVPCRGVAPDGLRGEGVEACFPVSTTESLGFDPGDAAVR